MGHDEMLEQAKQAFCNDDVAAVRAMLQSSPALRARVNEGIPSVRSREMLDALIEAGADINTKSDWWAGGFGLLHNASPALAAYAIERGATVDIHAAARLGMLEKLKALLAADRELVHARGGDGQTPLHFASTIDIANFLLEHGASIDARDVDHESTPAQYMVRERQAVARHLVSRGCATDILMAAALGDLDLVRRHIEAEPDSIRIRVSDEHFPMVGGRTGGTIYQWTLGWYVSAHQVARDFGHEHVVRFLMQHSPDDVRLVTMCWLGDEAAAASLLASEPGVAARLRASERRQLAHAARNNNLPAVRAMLAIGLPVDTTSQHGATPLHWASFHGNAEMVKLILRSNPAREAKDSDFQSTPLGWASHGAENGWEREKGDYPATIETLIAAGAKPPDAGCATAA